MPIQHILYIDDYDDARQLLQVLLGNEGYRITLAPTVRDGLSVLEETHIDLILLDMLLPDMNGFEFLEVQQNNPKIKDIPVIAITASPTVANRDACLEAGCTGYITKPFMLPDLRRELHDVLSNNIKIDRI